MTIIIDIFDDHVSFVRKKEQLKKDFPEYEQTKDKGVKSEPSNLVVRRVKYNFEGQDEHSVRIAKIDLKTGQVWTLTEHTAVEDAKNPIVGVFVEK